MSGIKRLMEQQEQQHAVGEQIAIEAGVLKRCEFHGEVYDAETLDHTPAYKLGNYKFTKGELKGMFDDRREMTDAIQAAIKDAGVVCGWCAKFEAE
jgi:hypothetical protein